MRIVLRSSTDVTNNKRKNWTIYCKVYVAVIRSQSESLDKPRQNKISENQKNVNMKRGKKIYDMENTPSANLVSLSRQTSLSI